MNQIKAATPNIEIYNCAAGGFGSPDGKDRAAYIAKLNPDYAVITSFALNDIWRYKLDVNEHKENMRSIIQAFNDSRVVVWLSPPVNDPNKKEESDNINQTLVQYNEQIKGLCGDMRMECIDSFIIYQDFANEGVNYHAEDGVHLTDEGYKPFINALAEILNRF